MSKNKKTRRHSHRRRNMDGLGAFSIPRFPKRASLLTYVMWIGGAWVALKVLRNAGIIGALPVPGLGELDGPTIGVPRNLGWAHRPGGYPRFGSEVRRFAVPFPRM